MVWNATWYSLVALCGAAGALGLVWVAYRHRAEATATGFGGLCLAIAAWSITYGIQIGFTDRATQLSFQLVVFAIAGMVPAFWLYFTAQFAGASGWLTRRRAALLAVEPVVFPLVELTNGVHGLVWERAVLTTQGAVPVLQLSFGVAYLLHVVYSYALVAIGLALLVRLYLRDSSLYRRQTALLIAGALPPFAAHVSYSLGVRWWTLPELDYTPLAFSLTVGAFGLALYRFDLLDRLPLAHERMIAEVGDGLVVLDGDGTVVDSNPVARRALDPAPTPGCPLAALGVGGGRSLADVDGVTAEAEVDGRTHAYDVSVSTLSDHRGDPAGSMLILRDVTDRHASEQRLEVANRILRHNLRNDMNKIIGFAGLIDDATPRERRAAVDRIVETAYGLVDLSEKAGRIAATSVDEETDPVDIDVAEAVAGVLDDFRRVPSAVRYERVGPDEAWASLREPELLSVALTNVVENAVEHNDAPDPRVTVTLEADGDSAGDSAVSSADDSAVSSADDSGDSGDLGDARGSDADDWDPDGSGRGGRVRVRIRDNGPGIPEMERRVIESGSETPLVHGSGVGLWLIHWSVETIGGTVTFETPTSGGTAVTITLPAARHRASPEHRPR